MTTKAKNVTEYLENIPSDALQHVAEIRSILKEIVPHANETIKWGVPVFEKKRILFSYAATKSYLTFMPTRSTLDVFKDELKEYTTGRDTIQFPYDKPLPTALIKKLAKYRVKEVKEGALWMHHE